MKKHVIMFLLMVAAAMPVPAQDSSSSSAAPGAPEKKGAWSNGFTAFTENLAKEKAGSRWEYRKRVLLEYGTFVHSGNDIALRNLPNNEDAASRVIGRGKTALVFDALRRRVGEEVFSRAAVKLSSMAQAGSWDDIKALFEKEADQDLGWFFTQWVDRKGLPELVM
jgi:hypothetical protein